MIQTTTSAGIAQNPVLPAVFLVLDLEASPNDVVWSVSSTMEKAIESQKELNDIRVGGAITKIVEEKVK